MNKLANDIDRGCRKNNLFYISNALLSAASGTVLTLTVNAITTNISIIMVSAILGAFIGTRSFFIASKILMTFFNFIKSDEFSSIFNEALYASDIKHEKEKTNKSDIDRQTDNKTDNSGQENI